MSFFKTIKNNIKYGLVVLLSLPFFLGGSSNAVDDLLWQAIQPSYNNENISTIGKNVNTVGNAVIQGSVELDVTKGTIKNGPSIIVKATRILLSLIVALSITMILYNGMMYIVKTGQGKEGKDLIKNVAYIVIGILVALFSVVIINIIQSVPKTLDEELESDITNSTDDKVIEGQGKKINSFKGFIKSFGDTLKGG